MTLTVTISAALMTGRGSIPLVPVCGTEDIARRGVRNFRILPRLIQPRAGHREHHGKPVPAALASSAGTAAERKQEPVNARSDVSRAHERAGHEKGRL